MNNENKSKYILLQLTDEETMEVLKLLEYVGGDYLKISDKLKKQANFHYIHKKRIEEIIKELNLARTGLMRTSCDVDEMIGIYYTQELQADISRLVWLEKELREMSTLF